ncbi:MAG: CshA/CshB family fibrillar adhesin-related protein [Burkholderiaceae bacterium]
MFSYARRFALTLLAAGSLLLPLTAQAQFATGGTGLHKGRIFWINWGSPNENVFNGKTVTRGFNIGSPPSPSNRLEITCSLSNAVRTRNVGGNVNPDLRVYVPGTWQGDGLDELYNVGGNRPGTGANPNTMAIGLAAFGGQTIEFDFRCSATLGGSPFTLDGLVFADAEASDGPEFSAARLTNGGTLRIIDSISNCGNAGTVDTTTAPGDIRLVPGAAGSCEDLPTPALRAGPALVGFIDGATAARVIVQGGGNSAVAVGAVLELEYSEGVPGSYGIGTHLLSTAWSGGAAVNGVNYVNQANLATLVTAGPRLGLTNVPDANPNGAIGGPDVDALPKTTGPLGEGYANVPGPTARGATYTISNISCLGPGQVAGWIDFNGNGTYDAGERSGNAACPNGQNNITLSWTVPTGTGYVAQPTSYLRLRTATGAANIAEPTGAAPNGETEDYRLVLPSLQADMAVAISGFPTAPNAGSPVAGTVTCTNNGPDPAAAPTCNVPTANLPPGATVVCTPNPAPNPLPVGQAITCQVNFTAPGTGPVTINATTTTTTPDPVAPNNSAQQVVNITPQADMVATASGFPTNPPAGSTATGTITCTNNGPSPAAAPTCNVSSTPPGAAVVCTPNPAPNPLPVGQSITCSVSYTVPPDGAITITGVAGSTTADPNTGNNTAQAGTAVSPRADMQAVTTVPASVNAGQPVSVSGTCTNNGPSPAASPTCALSGLPPGTPQTCTPNPAPNPLPVGQAISCSASFTAPSSGSLNITTSAGSGTADPVPANNTDTKPITVNPQADMAAAVSGFPTNPPAGSTATGTVTCTNNGPSAAANAACAVSGLPPGATVNCTPNNPVPSLAVGSAISCAVSYPVPASGAVTVTGTASTSSPDPNSANNTAQSTATVAPQADMRAVTSVPSSATAGQPVTVSGVCTNAGPSTAASPACALSGLPAGATQTCTPAPAPNPLAVGQSITCTSTFNAPASGPLNITTTAGSATPDPVPANNTDTRPVTVAAVSDMQAAVSGFPANPPAGSTATGTVTCTNNGPSAAPSPTCAVVSSPPGAAVSCTPNPAPNPLPVGQSITCSVSYTVPPDGAITITGTSGSGNPDPAPGNNTAQAGTTVAPLADMVGAVTAPATANAGASVTVSGTCTNAGPSGAVAPTCVLSGLPPGATQTCVPSPAPDPLPLNGVITCTSTFVAPASGPLNVAVTANSNTNDPNRNNNSSSAPIAIAPRADMSAAISGFPPSPVAGSTVTGTVTCTNNGPSVAADATCAVTGLPAGATVVCSPTTPLASLGVGSNITCNVSYTAPADGAAVTVTGTAGSATVDPNPGNEVVTAVSTPVPQADMRATLTGFPTNPAAGSSVTGTVTCSNLGPSPAAAPTCVPSGLPPGATVTCTPNPAPNPLPVGGQISCAVSFTAPASGAVNVTGTAGSTTADPFPANNTVTQVVAVTPQADMQAAISGFPANTPAGSPVSGTVTCTNNGPSPAAAPTCAVTGVPAGATVTCTPNPAPNPLPVGQSISCAVSFAAPANGAATITGVAGSNTPDPNSVNNTATTQTGSIDAVNDAGAAPVTSTTGGVAIPNVLANDTLNGAPATLATVTLRQTATTNPGVTLDPATGAVSVAPNTPPGNYTVTYEICTRTTPAVCDTATATVVVQGALSGSVWLDAGAGGAGTADRQRNPGEQGLQGWTVEVVFPPGSPQAGQIVPLPNGQPATALTDANGQYQIPGVPPGNYQVRFRAPSAGGAPGPVYGTPVNGESGNPQPGSAVNPATRTLDITMPSGGSLAQQGLPVDPSGVVYDSTTRQPVVGATVTLLGPNGQPVPANLLLPGQQGQTVVATGPAAGSYRFDLLPSAPPGTYTIVVTPPTGYVASQLIPPSPGPVTPGAGALCPGLGAGVPCPVQPQAGPPPVGASTTYYTSFTLTPGSSPDVIHNHIALDQGNPATLAIIKLADKREAEIGDPVKYTIRVKNLAATGVLPAVQVVDTLPLGFKYVPRTTRGLGSPAPVLAEPAGAPGPQLTFNLGALAAGAEATFTYYVRIGIGGADGDGINRALAQAGNIRSLTAQAKVQVRGGVLGAEACIVGKVFADCGENGVGYGNGNAIQDPGEPGIPGVRIYMQDGTYVITDAEGKYSLCGLEPRTHVLKVDPITLPKGARLGTTSNRNAGDPSSLFVDLKNGQLQRADFRDMSCNASVFDEVKRRRDAAPKGEQEDVNRARVEGDGQPGSGLGLPTDKPGNTTGATPVKPQGKEGGK